MAIRTGQFIYHLTSVQNISSILGAGLQPRSELTREGFRNVADPDIVDGRRGQQLERFVPFHWFAKNPFDGRVYRDRPDEEFVLIAVKRTHASQNNWRIIPRHPLAGGDFELLDYQVGIDRIDWDTMELRDYLVPQCKLICMAECLSPDPVPASSFAKIYTPSLEIGQFVTQHAQRRELSRLWIDHNPNMFPNR